MRTNVLLLLALLPACLLARGQGERQTFRAGITVVQVDVSVLDKQRHPVRGLKASDFTVLEDGKPRDIVAFTPVDLPARTATRAPGAAAWTRDVAPDVATNDVPAEGRLVVIAFDWSIRFDDSTLARKIARATVNDLGPGDEAAGGVHERILERRRPAELHLRTGRSFFARSTSRWRLP